MHRTSILHAVRGHLWGPVGSLALHTLAVVVVIRLATTAQVDRIDEIITGLREEAPVITPEKMANEIAQLDRLRPPDTFETTEMPVTPGDPSESFENLAENAGIGPGESASFGTVHEGLPGLDSAEGDGPLTLIGLTAGRKAGGGGAAFGHGNGIRGDLVGTMYDLKRAADGSPREPDYLADVRHLVEGRLGPKAFAPYFRITNQLYLSHLFVPQQPAENGPAAFGVTGQMEPRNWVVHYAGQIAPPENGRFRFVGMFDDLLMVFVDGRLVLEFLWTGDVTPWAPKDFVDQHACFGGRPLVYGDWIELGTSKPRRIDILVGEHPGGRVGGTLMIQQEGRDYEKAADGRPILPVFTVQLLSPQERMALNADPKWAFDNPAPVFNATVPRHVARPSRADADVRVDII